MSPHRTFLDDSARLWNAWDVLPVWGERRRAERRNSGSGVVARRPERRVHDRRHDRGLRIALPPRLASGWLAFERGAERRRVAPIPEGWTELDEHGLRELWRRAEVLPPRRKGLVE